MSKITAESTIPSGSLKPMLTTSEVAAILRVPVGTLYAWRSTGDGPVAHRFGKHLRFDARDVRAFVASKRQG